MADPITVNYAGQTHQFPPDATEHEISSALEQWEQAPRTPTGTANKELSRQGLQVSGQEMNPRVQANKVPVEYAGGGTGKAAGAAEGALSLIPEIGESVGETVRHPVSGAWNMLKGTVALPKTAGENIGNAVEAWRNNDPYTAGHEATAGALNTAGALSLAKPTAAGVSTIPKVGQAALKNAPRIGAGVGLVGGAVEAAQGRPWGLAYLPYLGEKGGRAMQRLFGNGEVPPPATVGKMKPGRVAGPQGQPSPIPPPEPAPVTGKIQPVGAPESNLRIPPTPRSKPPDVFEPRPVAAHEPTAVAPKMTEDEVAKAIGYPGGAKQAQVRLGPKWNETYERIANGDVAQKGQAAFSAGQAEGKLRNPPPPPVIAPVAMHEPTIARPQMTEPIAPRMPDPINRRLTPEQGRQFETQQENAQMNEMEAARERDMNAEQQRQFAARNIVGGTKGDSVMTARGIAAPESYGEQVSGRPPGLTGMEARETGTPMRAGQGQVDYITGKPIESEYVLKQRPGKLPLLVKARPK